MFGGKQYCVCARADALGKMHVTLFFTVAQLVFRQTRTQFEQAYFFFIIMHANTFTNSNTRYAKNHIKYCACFHNAGKLSKEEVSPPFHSFDFYACSPPFRPQSLGPVGGFVKPHCSRSSPLPPALNQIFPLTPDSYPLSPHTGHKLIRSCTLSHTRASLEGASVVGKWSTSQGVRAVGW